MGAVIKAYGSAVAVPVGVGDPVPVGQGVGVNVGVAVGDHAMSASTTMKVVISGFTITGRL